MTDRQILSQKFDDGTVTETDLSFGRKMPFGKYKGTCIYYLLVAHPYYMEWILKHTKFTLTETEAWWKDKIDTIIRVDNLLCGLSSYLYMGDSNIENPHWIVE